MTQPCHSRHRPNTNSDICNSDGGPNRFGSGPNPHVFSNLTTWQLTLLEHSNMNQVQMNGEGDHYLFWITISCKENSTWTKRTKKSLERPFSKGRDFMPPFHFLVFSGRTKDNPQLSQSVLSRLFFQGFHVPQMRLENGAGLGRSVACKVRVDGAHFKYLQIAFSGDMAVAEFYGLW